MAAEAEADRLAVEAQCPGWDVELSALGRWYAGRREPLRTYGGREYRPQLGADGPSSLCNLVRAFGK